ncbi:endonuclease domain-containing protein [Methylobacterium cerastii]|nr:DUF559 domain-containing protein [Methylobacterium cerastii]
MEDAGFPPPSRREAFMEQIAYARGLRRTQTRAGAKLWSVLRRRQLNGWKFRRQCPIDRYVADFVCIEANLIVEVDGATHSTMQECERDAVRTRTLESCGFAILRDTNAEIAENLDGVRETILAAVERRLSV